MSNPRVRVLFLLLAFSTCPLKADEVVRSVQAKLAALGYYKAGVDGSPGSMTSAAIRRFQLARKLKVTGSLNQQTLQALGIKSTQNAPEYTKTDILLEGGPLAGMDANVKVEAIRKTQRLLAESGCYNGPQNGLSSRTLLNAIKEWQSQHGLPPTGRLDAQTIAKLGIAKP
ncbi:MAG: peptidoglycan-binding protein [bacterium]